MAQPVAYLNGRFLPASELALPVYDAGFVLGTAVAEQLRTFGGRLFRLEQHLQRLRRSLEIVGVSLESEASRLDEIAREVVAHNAPLIDKDHDLGLCLFVTPGPYPTLAPPGVSGPTVCLHTYPLPFSLWASKYASGQALVVTDVRQVPASCWPAELKCRSRMHYYLADQQAAARQAGARALLLDEDGLVVEASTANLVVYYADQGLVSPPRERILPGVSLGVLEELAAKRNIPLTCRELRVEDVARADEAMLSSTSSCILPAVQLDGQPLGTGQPGPVFRQLLDDWSKLVGVDIRGQAERAQE